jgi:hypothetical protein
MLDILTLTDARLTWRSVRNHVNEKSPWMILGKGNHSTGKGTQAEDVQKPRAITKEHAGS